MIARSRIPAVACPRPRYAGGWLLRWRCVRRFPPYPCARPISDRATRFPNRHPASHPPVRATGPVQWQRHRRSRANRAASGAAARSRRGRRIRRSIPYWRGVDRARRRPRRFPTGRPRTPHHHAECCFHRLLRNSGRSERRSSRRSAIAGPEAWGRSPEGRGDIGSSAAPAVLMAIWRQLCGDFQGKGREFRDSPLHLGSRALHPCDLQKESMP